MVRGFGGYQIGKTIGGGSVGSVKLAVHIDSGKRYAIKVVDKAALASSHVEAANFKREVVITQQLDHRNVVKTHEVLQSDKQYLIVMDLADGGDLLNRIQEVQLDDAHAARYLADLACGLRYCHRRGVAHRDIKPENILICRDGTLKLADFGIGEVTHGNIIPGSVRGTPSYMAPEVISGLAHDPMKADIWSCGVVLYMLLTRSKPFGRGNPDMPELTRRILQAEFYRDPRLCPLALDLIQRMIKPDPCSRLTIDQVLDHPYVRPYVVADGWHKGDKGAVDNPALQPLPLELLVDKVETWSYAGAAGDAAGAANPCWWLPNAAGGCWWTHMADPVKPTAHKGEISPATTKTLRRRKSQRTLRSRGSFQLEKKEEKRESRRHSGSSSSHAVVSSVGPQNTSSSVTSLSSSVPSVASAHPVIAQPFTLQDLDRNQKTIGIGPQPLSPLKVRRKDRTGTMKAPSSTYALNGAQQHVVKDLNTGVAYGPARPTNLKPRAATISGTSVLNPTRPAALIPAKPPPPAKQATPRKPIVPPKTTPTTPHQTAATASNQYSAVSPATRRRQRRQAAAEAKSQQLLSAVKSQGWWYSLTPDERAAFQQSSPSDSPNDSPRFYEIQSFPVSPPSPPPPELSDSQCTSPCPSFLNPSSPPSRCVTPLSIGVGGYLSDGSVASYLSVEGDFPAYVLPQGDGLETSTGHPTPAFLNTHGPSVTTPIISSF